MKKKIILLEDKLRPLNHLDLFLRNHGFLVNKVTNLDFILPLLNDDPVDVVIVGTTQISMSAIDQLALGVEMTGLQNLPFIFLGEQSSKSFKVDISLKLVLSLPVAPQLLLKTISDLLVEQQRREDWAENHHLNTSLGCGDLGCLPINTI